MILRSPYSDIQIPTTPLTPFILERARKWKEKPALIEASTGRTLTYDQFADAVRRVAAGLARRGFRKDDVLAIFAPNSPEYAILFHAVSLLGGITTTVNPMYLGAELTQQLQDSNARLIFTTQHLAERLSQSANLKLVITDEEVAGCVSFEEFMKEAPQVDVPEIRPSEQIVALPYSSGTTGFPKGVMLTHANLVSNILQIAETGVVHHHDVLVCVLPMFHIYGLVVILNESLYMGATVVIMPRYDLDGMLRAIQQYRVTLAPLVPPILLSLTRNPMVLDYDLGSLQTIFSAAAPLSTGLAEKCSKDLGCLLKQGYGMTEASPATHMTPDEPERIKIGSVGVPVPNTECRITEVSTGKLLEPNQEGEIWIRGPQVMKGYLNRPDATAASIDSDGWLKTGDIGYADKEGYFYIVDRAKELIKFKGFQVAPAELEALLITHPAVADAAVIPIPDTEAGEVPKAFVVLKAEVEPVEILKFVASRVAPFKKVREIETVDQIPKSPSGKILRRILVEKERKKSGAQN